MAEAGGAERPHPGEAEHAEPGPGGVFSAETFALTSLILLAVPIVSGQILQLLTAVLLIRDQTVAVEQVSQMSIQAAVSGAPALLAALAAALSLALSRRGTRYWARWVALASLIMSLLLVIAALMTFVLLPAGTDLPPPAFPS